MNRRPKIMVCAHERSGTHFLMNTMADCFDYCSWPFLNVDYPEIAPHLGGIPVCLHRADELVNWFLAGRFNHNWTINNHLPVEFYGGRLPELLSIRTRTGEADFRILTIYRNPLDVMLSKHFIIKGYPRFEGPRCETVGEFIRATPCGGMTRYQLRAERNMLTRWENHVTGWLSVGLPGVIHVRFEDLRDRFEETVRDIGKGVGMEPCRIQQPGKERCIQHGPKTYSRADYTPEDVRFFGDEVGATMERLGYAAPNETFEAAAGARELVEVYPPWRRHEGESP